MNWPLYAYGAGALIAATLLLAALNLPKRRRFEQRLFPGLALVLLLFWVTLMFRYQPLLDTLFVNFLAPQLSASMGINTAAVAKYWPFFAQLGVYCLMLPCKAGARLIWGLRNLIQRLAAGWRSAHLSRPPAARMLRPAYFFSFDRGGVSLQDAWVGPGRYVRLLAALILLLCLALLYWLVEDKTIAPLLSSDLFWFTHAPLMPLLLLLELGWYLGGDRPMPRQERLGGKGSSSQSSAGFEELWRMYDRLCPERRLSSCIALHLLEKGFKAAEPVFSPQAQESAAFAFLRLIEQNVAINRLAPLHARQKQALLDGLNGKDLLLIEPVYQMAETVVCCLMQHHYLQGGRILALLPADIGAAGRREVRLWLERGLRRLAYTELPLTVGDAAFDHQAVQMATIEEAMASLSDAASQSWWSMLALALMPNTPRIFHANAFQTRQLCQLIADLCPQKPGYLLLSSSDRGGEESALRDFLGLNIREYLFVREQEPRQRYHVWKSEGSPSFQQQLLTVDRNRFLGETIPLAIPALREGLIKVAFFGGAKSRWREDVEELQKDLPSLALEHAVRFVHFPSIHEPAARTVAVGRDLHDNLVETLRRGLHFSSEEILLLILAPPYLLRDYLAANLLFFLDSDALSSCMLSPRPMPSQASIALSLYSRMRHAPVNEEQIAQVLQEAHFAHSVHELRQGLLDLFWHVFSVDLEAQGLLKEEPGWRYDQRQDCFHLFRHYRLIGDMHCEPPLILNQRYELRDAEDRLLASGSADQLYQWYLPGQVHGLAGEPYQVERIDARTRRVSLRHTQAQAAQYRHVLKVRLHAMQHCPQLADSEKTVNGYTLQFRLCEGEATVETQGYHILSSGWEYPSYQAVQCPERTYRHARILRLHLKPPPEQQQQQSAAHFFELSATLALLFSELMPTIFPETWRSLLVSCVGLEDGPHRQEKWPQERRPFDLLPYLEGEALAQEPQDGVLLYCLEDAHFDLGMIQAIQRDGLLLFALLEDFLVWLLESDNEERLRSQVGFGAAAISPQLRLQETLDLLANLLAVNPERLRHKRQRYYGQRPAPEDARAQAQCDFCGLLVANAAMEQLEDGRERCQGCGASAVDSLDRLHQVYAAARRAFVDDFGVRLRTGIEVSFVDAAEMARRRGLNFQPSPTFDPRAVGLAVFEPPNCTVLIENGYPFHQVFATIIHELTHVWQYDALDMEKLRREHGELYVEGQAMWAELHSLELRGQGGAYSEQEKKRLDIYGQGFRAVETLIAEYEATEPFSLLQQLFPRQ